MKLPLSLRPDRARSLLAAALLVLAGSTPTPTLAAVPVPFGRQAGLAAPTDGPRLIQLLEDASATVPQKARACQQLSLVGSAEAVPALAAMLTHPVLSAYARTVLEAIPDGRAADALRSALSRLEGAQLRGVVNSLGLRGDVASTSALVSLAGEPARGATAEALLALARIPGASAFEAVRLAFVSATPELKAAAGEACLIRAERELALGRDVPAAQLFDAVRLARSGQPTRLAAIRGAILSRRGQPQSLDLLLEHLRSHDAAIREVAAAAARELPGAGIGRGLVAALPDASPALRILLVRALAQRAEPISPEPIEALANASDPELALAALETLGVIGRSASVPALVLALGSNRSPAETEAAHASLVRLPARDADAAILGFLPSAMPATRVHLVAILGQRGARSAVDELLRQTSDANAAASRAALEALAAVALPEDLPRLVSAALRVPEGPVRDQAERTLYAVCVKQAEAARRGDPLAVAYRGTDLASFRKSLLQVMAMLGGTAGAETVVAACDDPSPEIRDTALKLLGHWPDASPAPLVLGIHAKAQEPPRRLAALQALVSMSALWKEDPAQTLPPPASIAWLTSAQRQVGSSAEEKRVLISGLGDLNCPEGLALLQPYLDDPAVRGEATRAMVRAAQGMKSKADLAAARPLLSKIAESTEDSEIRREVRTLIERAGPR